MKKKPANSGTQRFVVYTAQEGLENEPKVKIIPESEARQRFAETGGAPLPGEIYGSRWDHFHLGAVVGNFTAVEDAVQAAVDAGVKLQAEIDQALAEELAGAEDDEDRRQIEEYHEGHREVIVEFEPGGGTSPVTFEETVASLAGSKRRCQEFVQRIKRIIGQR